VRGLLLLVEDGQARKECGTTNYYFLKQFFK
jgi:hypothetical protein